MKNNKPIQNLWLIRYQKELSEKSLKPTFVQWIATTRCNFSCKHCGTDAGRAVDNELSTQEMLKVVDGLSELGCQCLSVTGGEPLLREDLFEILSYAKRKGIKITLLTNGYVIEDYIPQLKNLGLYGISISIDGYGKKHDRVRNTQDSYKRCLDSLDIYSRLKVPIIQVVTVVLKNNVKDIPKIINDIFKHGCTRYRLQLLIPEGRAKDKETPLSAVKEALAIVYKSRRRGLKVFIGDNIGYLGEFGKEVRGYKFFCGCGWSTFTIMQNGDIMGCPAIDHSELKEGNVRKTDIKEIWWSSFRRFRETWLESLPIECKECKYVDVCRGGCWAQRVNGGRFCYLDLAEELKESFVSKGR